MTVTGTRALLISRSTIPTAISLRRDTIARTLDVAQPPRRFRIAWASDLKRVPHRLVAVDPLEAKESMVRRVACVHANQAKAGKQLPIPLNLEAVAFIRKWLG